MTGGKLKGEIAIQERAAAAAAEPRPFATDFGLGDVFNTAPERLREMSRLSNLPGWIRDNVGEKTKPIPR